MRRSKLPPPPPDDDDDNALLSTINDLMQNEQLGDSFRAPKPAVTPSEEFLTEFSRMATDYEFLAEPGEASTSTTGDHPESPSNSSIASSYSPEVVSSEVSYKDTLERMSKDELVKYATRLSAMVNHYVTKEKRRRDFSGLLGMGGGMQEGCRPMSAESDGMASISASTVSVIRPAAKTTTRVQETGDLSEGSSQLNDYQVICEIGKGAYGKVYLAVDDKVDQTRAIKVVKKDRLKNEQSVRREIAVMKRLKHKNVVGLYEVLDDPDQDRIYLVMDYIECGPIVDVSKDFTCTTLEPVKAASLLRQLLSGLTYLHKHKVIHRDIKPDNILIQKDGSPMFADFGVSELTTASSNSSTGIRGVEGTPIFLAPELFSETATSFQGPPVDIWALGVTFYMALYGRPPFMGHSWLSISKAVNHDPLTFPPQATNDWKDILSGMLEKNPKKRLTIRQLKRHALFDFDADSSSRMADFIISDEEIAQSVRPIHSGAFEEQRKDINELSCSRDVQEQIGNFVHKLRNRIRSTVEGDDNAPMPPPNVGSTLNPSRPGPTRISTKSTSRTGAGSARPGRSSGSGQVMQASSVPPVAMVPVNAPNTGRGGSSYGNKQVNPLEASPQGRLPALGKK